MSDWYKEARDKLENPHFSDWDNFLISLINEFNTHKNKSLIQDIVIRTLERRGEIERDFILDHLLGELGLFPYLKNKELTSKDTFRTSFFTTPQDKDKVFHIRQAEVFYRIMNGENIILSAPTSFGKSLIIEALVSSHMFNNLVIVVPTIALIDELKKKLYKYSDYYKIVTQANQTSSKKNIFIFTQERVLESKSISSVDFFIIDEFYKLAPTSTNDERCDSLNLAFKSLYNKCKRFYMLGPRINGLFEGIEDELRCSFLKFDHFATVATNEIYFDINTNGRDADIDIERDKFLIPLLKSKGRDEQTVIYCKSPKRASALLSRILNKNILEINDNNNEFADWLSYTYHPQWSLVEGLKHGIAYHHAQIPRAVGSTIVDLFNESKINILICTSTLIEGVNTNAKNIVIYDDCITRKTKLDMFTFNNIAGRSGRMFEHYVGNVYIFGRKPQAELPYIDVPIVTQSENISDSLLLHLGDEVNSSNKERVKKFYEQEVLPLSILLKHQGIDPNKMINFAEDLVSNLTDWNPYMCWDGIYPNKKELKHISFILFNYFNISSMAGGSVRTEAQLNKKIIDIIDKKEDSTLIINDYNFRRSREHDYTIDDAVQSVFNFKKNLVNYNLPKILYAISDIQEYIFNKYGLKYGNYKIFASNLENFFFPSAFNALEEFGIPNQVSKKIFDEINLEDLENIDSILDFFRGKNSNRYSFLSDFENDFLQRVIGYL
ncbi:DEAD/DEAH box helicase family protein [Acinetobacter sp. 263903-1]|jgi:hypothetical protein|uniref:DEAD/DEAH box helicase n=1 Tax=Acinetobacter TaxID=469 RepID=UPI00049EABF4|nr:MULTISPECIES: DEAD/DEAH box helicase [Acinetobacter]KCX36197.1 DEAD/DEAH box helicase family protein [Acinetobacter sp. 263903-1]